MTNEKDGVKTRDIYKSMSSIDYRYWDPEVARFLSEEAFTTYKLKVEEALVRVLYEREICSWQVFLEVKKACELVTTKEVYEEEDRIHHDIRALVNCICKRVSDEAKRFVHMTATSFDISDSANAARLKDVVEKVVIPNLIKLEKVLVEISLREAGTVQIGRTHGQHAEPITFGFAIAEYVNRLGDCIESLKVLAEKLPGKFSGAVGAYNASFLFFDDPESFEEEVLHELGLKPARHSTQIVPPEPMTRLFNEITIVGSVLANLSDDMRNLQRSEIEEVGEAFETGQVGSSTMPHKRNPINFENVKGIWKILLGHLSVVHLNQISEHQRDLTNSVSARTYGESIGYLVSAIKRLTRTMSKLQVDQKNMKRNLETKGKLSIAEPLYIILAANKHPAAHEKVRQLTLQVEREKRSLIEIAREDLELKPYFKSMTKEQKEILSGSRQYTGIASKKAKKVARYWQRWE
ncbi:adenylosuccinate lyase [Candidatus Parcubacteria bacterium]|nr:adenylosuccinate lyase [Candidatus Parcubacteria bacterium]